MSEFITVYRFEDKKGEGPYRGSYRYLELFPSLRFHKNHQGKPTPDKDFTSEQQMKIERAYVKEHVEYFYGSKSTKDAFKWFGGLIHLFYKQTTIRLKKFKVNKEDIIYGKSNNQLLFIKPKHEITFTEEELNLKF